MRHLIKTHTRRPWPMSHGAWDTSAAHYAGSRREEEEECAETGLDVSPARGKNNGERGDRASKRRRRRSNIPPQSASTPSSPQSKDVNPDAPNPLHISLSAPVLSSTRGPEIAQFLIVV